MSGKDSPFTPSDEFWSSSSGASCCFLLAVLGARSAFAIPSFWSPRSASSLLAKRPAATIRASWRMSSRLNGSGQVLRTNWRPASRSRRLVSSRSRAVSRPPSAAVACSGTMLSFPHRPAGPSDGEARSGRAAATRLQLAESQRRADSGHQGCWSTHGRASWGGVLLLADASRVTGRLNALLSQGV